MSSNRSRPERPLGPARRRRPRLDLPVTGLGWATLALTLVVPWWLGLLELIGWATGALAAGIAP